MDNEEKQNLEVLEMGRPDFDGDASFLSLDEWMGVDVRPYILDFSKQYSPPEYTLTWKGIGFAPLGGIQSVTGQAGNGKTMMIAQFIAAILEGEFGQLRYNLKETRPTPKVLYIDTEMEEANTIAFKNRVLTISNRVVGEEYDDFIVVLLRDVSSEQKGIPSAVERWRLVLKAIYEFRPTVAFIDGLLDVVADFNDNVLCQETIYKCMQVASHYGISLWCLIHQNPGSDKMVGHLGSFIERKCTDIFSVKKEKDEYTGDVSFTVSQKKTRGRDIEDWKFRVLPTNGWGVPEQFEARQLDGDAPNDIRRWLQEGKDDIVWPATMTSIKGLLSQRGFQANKDKLQADFTIARNRRFLLEAPKEKGQKHVRFMLNPEEIDTTDENENEKTLPF